MGRVKLKRIVRWLFICLILVFSSATQVFANKQPISVEINNQTKKVYTTSVEVNKFPLQSKFSPYVYQERTFVPIREITELMGARVIWNQGSNSVTVALGGSEVKMKIDSNVVYLDGNKKKISQDSIPRLVHYNIKNGETKTMVPLRFLSESFGFNVKWNQYENKVEIDNGRVENTNVKPTNEVIKIENPIQKIDVSNIDSKGQNESNRVIGPEKKVGPLTIVLDPGHGGKDGGATAIDSQKEKDLNLEVAQKLVPLLQSKGYEIILTRNRDEYLGLLDRSNIANDSRAEIFLSIHFNSASSEKAQGIEVLYASEEDVLIKTTEQKYLAKELQNALIKETGAYSRGIKNRPDLSVLKRTEMTAALVELGFLSSPSDMADINSSGYLDKLARGIFNGIVNYESKYMN